MPAANDLRKGMAIKFKGDTVIVMDVQHRTPGNLRAFVQAIVRNIRTGKSMDVRFSSTEKVEAVEINRRKLEFSYNDNEGFHFMDPDDFETITFNAEFVGDAKNYLTENVSVEVLYAEGKAVQIELPSTVTLKVAESPEGVKGDTASNVQKPAVMETGLTVNVPLFIKEGESLRISTDNGSYLSRA